MKRLAGIKGSYLIAALITVVLAAWIATGEVVVGGQADSGGAAGRPAPAAEAAEPFRVAVRTFVAAERIASLTVRGRTEAVRRVSLKAETASRIVALPFAKGARVAEGDVVCRLDPGAREARVLQASAQVAQARLDHEAAEQLADKGFTSEIRLRAARAALDAANAALAEAELDLARTGIRAPFDGVIEEEEAEIGAYLTVGNPCLTLTAPDPLLAVGQVSERDIAALRPGMAGTALLVTGERAEGHLRFVARSADPATRTFRIELEIANPDGRLRDGVTARIELPLPPTRAHRISPAHLVLDDAGQIGVKTVDAGGVVHFVRVAIVGDEGENVWVAGLPERATVIVTGQDYVADGERVTPVPADEGAV